MFANFLRFFSINFHSLIANSFQRLDAAFKMQVSRSWGRLTTQTLMVGLLATVLWFSSLGLTAQAAEVNAKVDNSLDGRAYEADAVRQSRDPNSRFNVSGDKPVAPAEGLRQAPEDQVPNLLDNVKDAVQAILPGKSDGEGAGQNAYNPNTNPSANPEAFPNPEKGAASRR